MIVSVGLGREHVGCVVGARQVRPMFFLYFHFCVHWGACHVGVTISTNFVFSVSAPPHQVPLADRVLVDTLSQRFVLARWLGGRLVVATVGRLRGGWVF